MSKREPSLLTSAHREFLQTDVPDSDFERSQRSKIKRRLKAGMWDLRLVLKANAEGRIDVNDIFQKGGAGATYAELENRREEAGENPPPAYPMAALLFAWAVENPMFLDEDDVHGYLDTDEPETSPQLEMDRIARSYSNQIRKGVRWALDTLQPERVFGPVENRLEIEVGESVDDMGDDAIASLPRDSIDRLFRSGQLDNEDYARIMQIKLDQSDE